MNGKRPKPTSPKPPLSRLRAIPSVEQLLQALSPLPVPRPLALDLIRKTLAAQRNAAATPNPEILLQRLRDDLQQLHRSRLQPVINGTGILLHTNLGRALLSATALETLCEIGAQYCNLELDLDRGDRGSRAPYVEYALARLCRAEAAAVTNNCAAALVLILRQLTAGPRKEVLISRGELVQIGGGFRIPEILEASGAILREVGTTNQTTLGDYAAALGPNAALILKVHRSNFTMSGFVDSPNTRALASLARQRRLPLVHDLGSGAVAPLPLHRPEGYEPTPAEVLAQGADLVCFSGDKLLGGPQAGIIAGRKRLIQALKRNALFRALRCDKLILGALQATVDTSLAASRGSDASAGLDLPLHALLRTSSVELESRARKIIRTLADLPVTVTPRESRAQMGGGTLPQASIASFAIDLKSPHVKAETLAARLRLGSPPVVATLHRDRVCIDLRTVLPQQDPLLSQAIRHALSSAP